MALKKSKTNSQGITYDYWVAQQIANVVTKTTDVLLCGFVSQEARENGSNFVERIRVGTVDKLYPTGEEVYAFCKESRIVENDEEQTETNFFVDAEDC